MIKVCTSITGGKDEITDNQETEGADFIAYTEQESDVWETRPPCDLFKGRRRNSKPPKIIPHLYMDYDIHLWMDGHMELQKPAPELVDEWLDGYDFAMFAHIKKDKSVYEEIEEEIELEKGDPRRLTRLYEFYQREGVPEDLRLVSAGFILRRNNERVNRFNNEWWARMTRFAQRDQTMFTYLKWKHPEVKVNMVEFDWNDDIRVADGEDIVKFNFHRDLDPTR